MSIFMFPLLLGSVAYHYGLSENGSFILFYIVLNSIDFRTQ